MAEKSTAGAIRAGAAYVELFLKDTLDAGLNKAQKRLQAFGSSLSAYGTRMMGAGSAILAPLLASAKIYADLGSEIDDVSQRTSLSIRAVQELGFAAEMSGAGIAELESALTKQSKTLAAADEESKKALKTLEKLGLNFSDLQNQDPESAFYKVAKAISEIDDPSKRAAAAMEVWGKAGEKLLPMLTDGVKGLEDLVDEAHNLGLVLSKDDVKAAAAFGDAIDQAIKSVKYFAFNVGAELAPDLKYLAGELVKTLAHWARWARENGDVIRGLAKLGAVLFGAGAALFAISQVTPIFAFALQAVGIGLGLVGTMLSAVIGLTTSWWGLLAIGVVALGGLAAKGTGAFTRLKNGLVAVWEIATEAFAGIRDALMAGDLALAWEVIQAAAVNAWVAIKLAFVDAWNMIQSSLKTRLFDAFVVVATIADNAWQQLYLSGVSVFRMLADAFADIFQIAMSHVAVMMWDMMIDFRRQLPAFMGGVTEQEAGVLKAAGKFALPIVAKESAKAMKTANAQWEADQTSQSDTTHNERVKAAESMRGAFGFLWDMWAGKASKAGLQKEAEKADSDFLDATHRAYMARRKDVRNVADAPEAKRLETAAASGELAAKTTRSMGTFAGFLAPQLFGPGTPLERVAKNTRDTVIGVTRVVKGVDAAADRLAQIGALA